MTTIFSPVDNNCLILGFTGPLASGCSTAAKYFTDNDIIPEYCNKYVEGYKGYKKLKIFKDLDATISNYYESPKSYDELKEILRNRALKTTLDKHDIGKYTFCKISMSSMILKFVIEYCYERSYSDFSNSHSKYAEIIKYINNINECVSMSTICEINRYVKKREYTALKEKMCKEYDKYLDAIEEAKKNIKKNLESNYNKYISLMQDLGNNIRNCGNPFDDDKETNTKTKRDNVTNIAESVNNLIKYMRYRDKNQKNCFVIESLRNPFEIEHLRFKYYHFYLISITASKASRESRREYDPKIEERDMGTGDETENIHKNNVSKCVYLSDIQIDNSKCNQELLGSKLIKYFALILSPGCITPTSDETFMNQACMLSFKSTCISHQVGAIIVGKDGYIVGAGWNDVGGGQIGCGLRQKCDVGVLGEKIILSPKKYNRFSEQLGNYEPHDSTEMFCYKDVFSKYMMSKKLKKLAESEEFKKIIDKELETEEKTITKTQLCKIVDALVNNMKPKQVEYCRAVHAEENAFLQSVKIGGMGVSGGTLYTTFFPCELCAKMIYQSGIKKVVFVEPYPNSVSEEVFLKDGIQKVELKPFEGVKAHSFYKLFKANYDKKECQIMNKDPFVVE